jgi:hypothetical protein
MKSFTEWMAIKEDKEIKTRKDDVNWGGNKQRRDVRLGNTVYKPKKQPQVEE